MLLKVVALLYRLAMEKAVKIVSLQSVLVYFRKSDLQDQLNSNKKRKL